MGSAGARAARSSACVAGRRGLAERLAAAEPASASEAQPGIQAERAWIGFRRAAASSFAFVEAMGLTCTIKLGKDPLGSSKAKMRPRLEKTDLGRLAPSLAKRQVDGRDMGLTAEARLALADGARGGLRPAAQEQRREGVRPATRQFMNEFEIMSMIMIS